MVLVPWFLFVSPDHLILVEASSVPSLVGFVSKGCIASIFNALSNKIPLVSMEMSRTYFNGVVCKAHIISSPLKGHLMLLRVSSIFYTKSTNTTITFAQKIKLLAKRVSNSFAFLIMSLRCPMYSLIFWITSTDSFIFLMVNMESFFSFI